MGMFERLFDSWPTVAIYAGAKKWWLGPIITMLVLPRVIACLHPGLRARAVYLYAVLNEEIFDTRRTFSFFS